MVEPAPGTPADLMTSFLANLMKAALTADDRHSLDWRQSAKNIRLQLAADPDGVANLRIDGLWLLGAGDAERPERQSEQNMMKLGHWKTCPFSISEICAEAFDVDRAVQHIRETAATG